MRRKIAVPAILVVAIAGITGGLALTHTGPFKRRAAAPVAVAPVPVVADTVTQHDVPIYLSGVGTVIAYNTVVVRSQIQGQIVSINFTEGQTVHVGDLLAQIDPRPYQALIAQYTGNAIRPSSPMPRPISPATPRWEKKAGPRRNCSRPKRRKWGNCWRRSRP